MGYYDGTDKRWIPHDHKTPWQACRECGFLNGEGITTPYDAAYYASPRPQDCPKCGSQDAMGLTETISGRWEVNQTLASGEEMMVCVCASEAEAFSVRDEWSAAVSDGRTYSVHYASPEEMAERRALPLVDPWVRVFGEQE